MEAYKKDFIDFMVESKVLTFGDFTTKSGRKTPFFINTGNYKTGRQIARLGEFYAKAIQSRFVKVEILFGPAYKGIPLVITTSMALTSLFNNDVSFCFNRKEVKDHGEGGSLVGSKLQNGDRVLIIEDVTTAGTSIRETIPLLKSVAAIEVVGLIVSVDRMEKGLGEKTALTELQEEFAMPTGAIVTLDEIIDHLYNNEDSAEQIIDDATMKRIEEYRKKYGAIL